MATKESKAIKQLKKQVKKLNARIDDMSREIKGLQDTTDTTTEQMEAELQGGLVEGGGPGSRFSQDEVEIADEMTEDAEEIADIKEKEKNRKKSK